MGSVHTLRSILFCALLSAAGLAAQGVEEYQVKAAFLFNFAKFVEWPPEAFPSADGPIRICIYGQNPFGSVLEDTVRGKVVANRSLVVHQISKAQEAIKCHIVFVSGTDGKQSSMFLEELRNKQVLTVCESDGVSAAGAVIDLRVKNGRVHIEIDLAAAERARLRISSKLLSLAEIKK